MEVCKVHQFYNEINIAPQQRKALDTKVSQRMEIANLLYLMACLAVASETGRLSILQSIWVMVVSLPSMNLWATLFQGHQNSVEHATARLAANIVKSQDTEFLASCLLTILVFKLQVISRITYCMLVLIKGKLIW